MSDLSDIRVVRSVLERYGFRFSKSLGQNFIIDPTVCPRIAELGGAAEGVGVIEIGPGIGVLTEQLAMRADKVVAIELDKRLIPVLGETLSRFDNVEVVNADVLKTDLDELISEKLAGLDVVICANLPYYLTSPILTFLLESRVKASAITVMVQKEAAERLCATVGSREAGAITVAVDYYSSARRLFDVSPSSFIPAPKVHSSVIRLDVRPEPPVALTDEAFFFRMVRAIFAQRRKTAANSISSGTGIDKDTVCRALAEMGMDASARAETFTMPQLATLANLLSAPGNG